MEMLIIDIAERIIQKRKSSLALLNKRVTCDCLRQDEYIQFWPQGWSVVVCVWDGGRERRMMESGWEVLVLPVIFITPG